MLAYNVPHLALIYSNIISVNMCLLKLNGICQPVRDLLLRKFILDESSGKFTLLTVEGCLMELWLAMQGAVPNSVEVVTPKHAV